MRIKIAILEKDQGYLGRIVPVFSTRYGDKLEVYSFTDPQVAMSTLDPAKIDVLLASDSFDIDISCLPKRCSFAYLVDSVGVDTVKSQKAICKFQKAELIYKQILSIYSEKAGSLFGLSRGNENTHIFIFSSPSGGTGTSTMAAACARYFAFSGKRTLYLNLEKFGSADVFFSADGQFDISDVIYALKSKKTNLAFKLESCVKQDPSGVYFYSQSKVALDMLELRCEDKMLLLSELRSGNSYDYIVVDMDFEMNEETLKIYRQAHEIIWVGDGSEISNEKISRAFAALSIKEERADLPLINRIALLYNKFSNKSGGAIEGLPLKNIGGAPRYEHASTRQVLEQLSRLEVFSKIL